MNNSVLLTVIFCLILLGAGCNKGTLDSFPPKPPVPGFQQSPLIDRVSP